MKTILVVDDEFSIVEMLSTVLQDEGYLVVTASNGQEALGCLKHQKPDIILCDMMMPVLDGREMCRKVQANPLYRSIPFVLMSAVSKAAKFADCNYAALLAKPFDLDNLLKIVGRLTSSNA